MEVCQRIIELRAEDLSYGKIAKTLSDMKMRRIIVRYIIKRFDPTKSIKDKPASACPQTVKTPRAVKAARAKIRLNPQRSTRKMAREA